MTKKINDKVRNKTKQCKTNAVRKNDKKKKKKMASRRSIVKGTKTAWIYFCNKQREDIIAKDPNISFGNICKKLAPMWKKMSDSERKPYYALQQKDKERYAKDLRELSEEQKKILKHHRKQKRTKRKNKPKQGLSAYMYFVIENRKNVVTENPEANFRLIGKLLGQKWNELSMEKKQTYLTMSEKDKLRYRNELQQSIGNNK
jgi:hypothetical protein